MTLQLVLRRKFNITFTGGKLEQPYGGDVCEFVGSGVRVVVLPERFKSWERDETGDLETLIFSDPAGDRMLLRRSTRDKAFPVARFSKWAN